MAEQDYYMKKLLEDKERFADFVNVNVFHGRQVLTSADLTHLPNESGIVVIDSDGTKRTIERRRDIVMKAQLGAYFCIVASENQGKVHYARNNAVSVLWEPGMGRANQSVGNDGD